VNISPSSSPLAFFAAEVKRLRANAEMTQEQVADAVNYSASTIAAIETCRLLPSEDFAKALDKVLGTDGHFERLQELVEETSVLPWFRDLPRLERAAIEIRMYETYQIPALLQTEDYVRAIAHAHRPVLSDMDIDAAVALRTSRREVLEHDIMPPVNYEITPRLWAIMDESALRRVVGNPQVMRAQCDHLITISKRPNITIQVVPDDKGATCAFGRGFEILTSKSETVIYVEDIGSARCSRKTDEANRYVLAFDYLRASALDDRQSANLIRDYRDERYV
jgi:transcriptional regulator with XRE-family HTH domain